MWRSLLEMTRSDLILCTISILPVIQKIVVNYRNKEQVFGMHLETADPKNKSQELW